MSDSGTFDKSGVRRPIIVAAITLLTMVIWTIALFTAQDIVEMCSAKGKISTLYWTISTLATVGPLGIFALYGLFIFSPLKREHFAFVTLFYFGLCVLSAVFCAVSYIHLSGLQMSDRRDPLSRQMFNSTICRIVKA